MDSSTIRELLEDFQNSKVTLEQVVEVLGHLPYSDLGFAKIDTHRPLRQKMAEAIYCPGKSPEQCRHIVSEMLSLPGTSPIIMTRASIDHVRQATKSNPGCYIWSSSTSDDPMSSDDLVSSDSLLVNGYAPLDDPPISDSLHTVTWRHQNSRPEKIVILTAGTSDLPVARECFASLAAYGFKPNLLIDCGVAGIHRLLSQLPIISDADIVIVIAGMEGALASVVGGLIPAPIIAIPTSTGYGSSFSGITALLSMLASCASGISVVGIDNGFGAAMACLRILGSRQNAT